MAVFVIIERRASQELRVAIESVFPDKHWRIADNAWFVISDDTPKKISDALGIRKGGITGVIVMRGTAMYYGVASTAMWEWLKSAIERSNDD